MTSSNIVLFLEVQYSVPHLDISTGWYHMQLAIHNPALHV